MKIKKTMSILVVLGLFLSLSTSMIKQMYTMAQETENESVNEDNEYSPKNIKILKENPIQSEESIEFSKSDKVENITKYILFYSKYNMFTIKDKLKNLTYEDILNLNKENESKVKIITLEDTEDILTSFSENQVDILDGEKSDLSKDDNHIYVASIGVSGILGISEANKSIEESENSEIIDVMNQLNLAENKEKVKEILDKFKKPGWDKIKDEMNLDDISKELFEIKEKNNFKDPYIFTSKLSMIMNFVYTKNNCKELSLDEIIKVYNKINVMGFENLSKEEKEAVVTLIKIKEENISSFNIYSEIFTQAMDSIKSDKRNNLAGLEEELLIGRTYKLDGYNELKENEQIHWISYDTDIATINKNSGEITPQNPGKVKIGYVITRGYEITSYGSCYVCIKDTKGPKSKLVELESGMLKSLIVAFDEKLSRDTTNLSDANDFIDEFYLGNKKIDFEDKENTVQWIDNKIAKVILKKPLNIKAGENISIKYKSIVTDVDENIASDLNSQNAKEDEINPLGKIYVPENESSKVRIRFNEIMNNYTNKTTKASEILYKLEIYNGNELQKTINLKDESINWNAEENYIEFNVKYQFKQGDYIKPYYKDDVCDSSGNKIMKDDKFILVGGNGESEDESILQNDTINKELRISSGGKTPKIGIIAFLDEDIENKSEYISKYALNGFEPVFINGLQDLSNEKFEYILNKCDSLILLDGNIKGYNNMFLQNKNNITAIKQLKSSSGLILGIGLGSNIQSEIMIGKGNSYEYLKDSKFGNQEFLNNGFIVDGFGNLSNDIIVDSDFDNRGRLGRVISTLKNNNKKCGIGINEQSAIMIKNNEGYVIGNNGVFIIDTSYANFNKEDKSEFEATNIKLNYLTSGDSINLKTMKVKTSKNEIDLNDDNNIYNSEDIFNSYETTKIITSLVKSNANVAKGLTKEDDPRFTLLFNKNKDTSSYLENDKLTITNLVLNVTNSVVENIINKPVINAKDKTILLNKEFNLLKGVTAQDKEGNDLTKKIVVTKNTVNIKKLGTYNVCYEVTDSYGQSSTKEIKVEVVAKVEYENEVQNMENKVLKFISTYGYLGIIIAFMMSTFINRWDKMK